MIQMLQNVQRPKIHSKSFQQFAKLQVSDLKCHPIKKSRSLNSHKKLKGDSFSYASICYLRAVSVNNKFE